MIDAFKHPLDLAGRFLLALLFIPAGAAKFGNLAATAGYIASVGLPLPQTGAILAAAVELLGGIALVVGFGTRAAALALAAFTLVATYLFHAYWTLPADQQMMQQLMFFKNIAVVGGLLLVAAWGPAGWSCDAYRRR